MMHIGVEALLLLRLLESARSKSDFETMLIRAYSEVALSIL